MLLYTICWGRMYKMEAGDEVPFAAYFLQYCRTQRSGSACHWMCTSHWLSHAPIWLVKHCYFPFSSTLGVENHEGDHVRTAWWRRTCIKWLSLPNGRLSSPSDLKTWYFLKLCHFIWQPFDDFFYIDKMRYFVILSYEIKSYFNSPPRLCLCGFESITWISYPPDLRTSRGTSHRLFLSLLPSPPWSHNSV